MGSCCSNSVVFVRDLVNDVKWNVSLCSSPLKRCRKKFKNETNEVKELDTSTQTEETVFLLMKSKNINTLKLLPVESEVSNISRIRNDSTIPGSSIISFPSSMRRDSDDTTVVKEVLTVIERLQSLCSIANMSDQVSLLCTISHLREYCVLMTDIAKNGKPRSKSFLESEHKDRKKSDVNFWVSAYNGQNQEEKGIKKFKKIAVAVKTALTIANISANSSANRPQSLALAERSSFGMISKNSYQYIREKLPQWDFDQFELDNLTNHHGLSLLFTEIMEDSGLLSEFNINSGLLTKYCIEIENGYRKHNNPYHNEMHGADVLQTTYFIITSTKITEWLSQLELLSILFSAMIHDLEHTGTNNSFHQQSSSTLAMLYNDKSILENHHVSRAYQILEEINPFEAMSGAQFRSMREIVVECVLSTDMAHHFQQVRSNYTFILNTIPNCHANCLAPAFFTARPYQGRSYS